MPPSFLPRLIHQDPFADPGLFLPFSFLKRALLFDMGDLSGLSSRDLLKISHTFVSHTHLDHFFGFDRILRLFLGRELTLHVHGPRGIFENIKGKLASYTWNLVEGYRNTFLLRVTEISEEGLRTRTYSSRERFAERREGRLAPFTGRILEEPGLVVSSTILDHGIDCLAFALAEKFHVNVLRDRLTEMGLAAGPWLSVLKRAVHENPPPETLFAAATLEGGQKKIPLGLLMEKALRVSPGQKIAYVTDAAPTRENRERILALARDADHLYIEASFLEEDRSLAEEKMHLTAKMAGRLAREANARDFTIFHFSPRYTGREGDVWTEAREAFAGA